MRNGLWEGMFVWPRKLLVWELRFYFILDGVEEGHAKSWGLPLEDRRENESLTHILYYIFNLIFIL